MNGEGIIFTDFYYYEGEIEKGRGEGKGKIFWFQ